MTMRRITFLATLLIVAVSVSGWTHGSAPSFKGANWHDVQDKVPCQYVAKVGKDLKINATLVVDGKSYPNPTVTEPGVIDELDKMCFPKH
jgi:hypothetical protein